MATLLGPSLDSFAREVKFYSAVADSILVYTSYPTLSRSMHIFFEHTRFEQYISSLLLNPR